MGLGLCGVAFFVGRGMVGIKLSVSKILICRGAWIQMEMPAYS